MLHMTNTIKVRAHGWHGVEVEVESEGQRKQYELHEPQARILCKSGTLSLVLPDAAIFARIVECGLLAGQVTAVELRLVCVPDWLAAAVRPPRLAREVVEFSWRRRGYVLDLRVAWRRPESTHLALTQLLGLVLRARLWDQTGGPVFAVDRAAWLAGRSTWPQAVITNKPADEQRDQLGRPVGPYIAPPQATGHRWSIISGVTNPYGRVLTGAAARYLITGTSDRLIVSDPDGAVLVVFDRSRSPEAAILASSISKYAVAQLDKSVPLDPFNCHAFRLLGACGLVFASHDVGVREALRSLGLVVADDPGVVGDLPGYVLSVEASRRMAIHGDPALRRTKLADDDVLPLPSVTVVISSKRPHDLAACVEYLSSQTYPALEIVLGTHGYRPDEETRARLVELVQRPLRIDYLPTNLTLGEGLGRLTRIADGELIAKMDDDDQYGPNHVTDLVLAWHQTGADIVAKGARFVYLPHLGKTLDRAWAAPEMFGVTPAGGTLMIARSTLQQIGGWSTSSRHVDADLIARVRGHGGLTYRTHGLEYVYVRRSSGHTWSTELDELIKQSERTYDGLPAEVLRPGCTPHTEFTAPLASRPTPTVSP
jgi:hypothetical protein